MFNKIRYQYPDFGYVEEYGREYGIPTESMESEDLEEILKVHATRYLNLVDQHVPVIVMDTDYITTLAYAQLLGKSMCKPWWAFSGVEFFNCYHIKMSADSTVPLINDGTRLGEDFRQDLDNNIQTVLSKRDEKYVKYVVR